MLRSTIDFVAIHLIRISGVERMDATRGVLFEQVKQGQASGGWCAVSASGVEEEPRGGN